MLESPGSSGLLFDYGCIKLWILGGGSRYRSGGSIARLAEGAPGCVFSDLHLQDFGSDWTCYVLVKMIELRAVVVHNSEGVHYPNSDVRDPRAASARDPFLVRDSIRQLASDDQGVPDQATKDVRDPIEATRSIPAHCSTPLVVRFNNHLRLKGNSKPKNS
ncbi:hypothetical protein F2Q70_00002486 [Brassica cretica]|uniref:Uncharacterized protein n=1 Tax=Brassica cretica TaxID=69181 RepID=A0A8S9IS18_BRACR|nr:hypothetical protein F2Q70_00002486 [Brassica cretica]